MIGAIVAMVWLIMCLIMGTQSDQIGLALGFWLFTIVFVWLSTGSSESTRSHYRQQNKYDNAYRNYAKERKESKKGTIEFIEIKRK